MKTSKMAIAIVEEMKEWAMRTVRGEERRDRDGHSIWFPSAESFVKTQHAGYRELLRVVARRVPVSLDELARMTGRAVPDYSGMPTKLVEMELIELYLRDGSRFRSRVAYGHVNFDMLPI